ncbi:MAG: YncE family protein [Chloroflexota bacterium]|nr:YncE family protein [Chloroflexota bacterium]
MRRALGFATLLLLVCVQPAAAFSVVRTIAVGSQPFGVAAVGSGLLYVANSGGSTVSIIDIASNTVTGSIAVGSGPGEIVTDDAAGRAYVGNFNSGTVSVIDTAARSTIGTLSPGGLGVAVDPGLGRLYAVTPSRLTVFDTTTLVAVATVTAPSDAGWWSVAVDPLRHLGYLGDLAGGGVTVVDLTTNAIVTTIDVGGPVRFALTADPSRGRLFAATDTAPGRLAVIDASTNAVTRTVTVGNFPSHIVPVTTSTVYVTDLGSDDLAMVDPTTGAVTRVSVGPKPAGLAVVGTQTYVALNGSNAVALLGNSAPVVDSVTVSPSSARTNDTLAASVAAHDADGDTLTYAFQWTRNGVDISAATTATLDLSVAGTGERGDAIAVRVTASDGTLSSAPLTSSALLIQDTAPVATVALNTTTPGTHTVLVATATASDADADPLTFTYVWKVNGVTRQTTTTSARSDSFDPGQPGNGNKGDVVTVELVARDGTLSSPTATASATVVAGKGR